MPATEPGELPSELKKVDTFDDRVAVPFEPVLAFAVEDAAAEECDELVGLA